MMKRASLIGPALFVALSLCVSPAHAQFESWGLTAGVTSMTGTGEGLGDVDRRTGFTVGGTVQMDVAGPLSLRPELLFIRKGWSFEFGEVESTVTLDYFEVPVLADVAVASIRDATLHVVAGPTVSVMVNSGVSVDVDPSNDLDPSDTLSRTEVGFAVGTGARGQLGPQTVRLDVRYRLSLSNINEQRPLVDGDRADSAPTIRNRGLSVTVGLAF